MEDVNNTYIKLQELHTYFSRTSDYSLIQGIDEINASHNL